MSLNNLKAAHLQGRGEGEEGRGVQGRRKDAVRVFAQALVHHQADAGLTEEEPVLGKQDGKHVYVFDKLFLAYKGVRMGDSPRLPRIRRCGASCHLQGSLELVIFLSTSFLLFLYP